MGLSVESTTHYYNSIKARDRVHIIIDVIIVWVCVEFLGLQASTIACTFKDQLLEITDHEKGQHE